MSNLSWEAPGEILSGAEGIVTRRSPYAERPEWAETKRHHALWAEPIIYAMQALPVGSNVLDVGPGYGALAVAATMLGHHVTAVELFLDAQDLRRRIEWVRGDICDPQVLAAHGAFDFAIMAEVLEHLTTDPAGALANIAGALKPGAPFMGSTPTPGVWPGDEPCEGWLPAWNEWRKPEDKHVRLYSQEEVADLLTGAGFEVLSQEGIGEPPYRHLWRAQKAVAL